MLITVLASRRPSLVARYVVPASILVLLAYCFSLPTKLQMATAATVAQLHQKHRQQYHTPAANANVQPMLMPMPIPVAATDQKATPPSPPPPPTQHPIERLVAEADKQFRSLLAQETHTLEDAAAAYRKRRGRHPPPGFDRWHRFARERNVVFVESFWDQIYHDLHPFWALPPKPLQREARDFEMTIHVRRGRVTTTSDWFWTQIWLDLLKTIESELPDMDIALNAMDEPRVVVAWEAMQNYVVEAERTQGFPRPEDVQETFQSLPLAEGHDDNGNSNSVANSNHKRWTTTGPYWELVRRGCAPQSMARQTQTAPPTTNHGRPDITDTYTNPHMYRGFVANSSLSSDVCHQPDLAGLNGIFIEPLSISTTDTLLPIFGGSKLSVNSDILLPAPMYWSNEARFGGGSGGTADRPWSNKTNGAIWRGVATGGHNRAENWKGFHRHRFVAMNNGSLVAHAESDPEHKAPNMVLPAASYNLQVQKEGGLGTWVSSWSDCGFVDLMCDGGAKAETNTDGSNNGGATDDKTCSYVDDYFSAVDSVSLPEQFHRKLLPDIDGNSFSGRYLAFLKSSSLPVKATVWKEWHDARLVAWKHFVPMDNRYGDWYGIVDFFLGGGGGKGEKGEKGDRMAEAIASAGKAWADRVLRREDMQVYVLRLLLEYARVLDEKRELLGWVGDLKT
ncbi:hypothetical protein SPBR_05714 [Sporothrix brasiliensis 5110]|uniref:Glycosyl transferase CAP10 domain-containing protein n=1 Tax=Sporothrix brasiliensis 5110 TaxID=1398154 RepID=A0A0C2IXI3_9PEZI|nr:uncharacterized protein SPBR_05714 [Sporothrix brasiliensis 5110]KIH93836.1 hypothetical protein SPBR_05714 [Sporothrix brasiliensis 5110]